MRRGLEPWLVVALCAILAWFYGWTAHSSSGGWGYGARQTDYYNMMIRGWRAGHVHLDAPVPEELLRVADPYDPAQRPASVGMHDASFYRGKYYVYFGPATAAVLMLPYRLITGVDLPLGWAVVAFAYGGFLASTLAWLLVRRRYFPETGTTVVLLGVLALGVAGLGPMLVRRPHIWELPIAGGYCFAMLAFVCLFQSLHARRGLAWYAAAGLCLGLAVASRATYLFGLAAMLVPLWHWRKERRPEWWRRAIAGVAPLIAIGLALAAHNYARFGDPLEFGQKYQFSAMHEAKIQHFSASFIPFNLSLYFWGPARWSAFFPFIAVPPLTARPPGHGGMEDVFGLVRNLPIAWLALAAPLALWRREAKARAALGTWLIAVVALVLPIALLLQGFFGAHGRYLLDFAPSIMLLAMVGVLAVERGVAGWWQPVRAVVRAGWAGVLLVSVVFGILYSLVATHTLPEKNPALYAELGRRANVLPAAIDRFAARRYGAWEMDVRWLAPRAGTSETLLSIGDPPVVDRIFVRWLDGSRAQFGFARDGMPEIVGEPVALAPGTMQRVRLEAGAFLPAPGHPWFAGLAPDAVQQLTRRVRIAVDGRTVLLAHRRFEKTAGGRVRVGGRALGSPALPRFTGEITGSEALDLDTNAALGEPAGRRDARAGADGVMALRVRWPAETRSRVEPLVVTGATGGGDILGIEYLGAGRARFVFDHWGAPLRTSESFGMTPGREQDLRVRMESAVPTPAREWRPRDGVLRVELGDGVRWEITAGFHPADAAEIAIGFNPIGGSQVGAEFSGAIAPGAAAAARRD